MLITNDFNQVEKPFNTECFIIYIACIQNSFFTYSKINICRHIVHKQILMGNVAIDFKHVSKYTNKKTKIKK